MSPWITFENPAYLFFLIPCLIIIIISLKIKSTVPVKRKIISLIIRILVLCLFICALSGMKIAINEAGLNFFFLVDVSDSIDKNEQEQALRIIKNLAYKKNESDTISVISFGRNAVFEIEYQKKVQDIQLTALVDTTGTNIENALQTACAHLPGKGENRIILFSDGNENKGSALRGARLAKGCGVSINAYLLDARIPPHEVLVKKIYGPGNVKKNEPHDIHIIIESSGQRHAFLTLLKDNTPVFASRIELEQGENFFKTTSVLSGNGLHTYEAIINTENDFYPENNYSKLFVHVKDRPEILYVYGKTPHVSIINALTAQGIGIRIIPYTEIPVSLAGLSGFSGIIFDTIGGQEISFNIMDRIEEYVRDTGGGFFMITGSDVYALSGFSNTKIEKLLPVHLFSQERFSTLAVVMVVDRSASMKGEIDIGLTKLDVVKNALLKTVDTLKPSDHIGILVFDDKPEWIVAFEDSINRKQVKNKISGIASGGGTNMYQAIQEAYRILSHIPARFKHIIMLSDGKSENRKTYDYEGLLKAIAHEAITVSTIAVGKNADTKLLSLVAEWGEGTTYYTEEKKRILSIYLDEMERISENAMENTPFQPRVGSLSEIVKGIDTENIPALGGYINTTLKQGSQEILTRPGGPLFAAWHYGLGKSSIFLSGFQGNWGKQWPLWKNFSQFIAQATRWIERESENNVIKADFQEEIDNSVAISADVKDISGEYMNFLEMKAHILYPDKHSEDIQLHQNAPGLYSSSADFSLPGDYFITIIGKNREKISIGQRTYGITTPYSPEYIDFSQNRELLKDCAALTGGKILVPGNKESEKWLFTKSEERNYIHIWGFLVYIGFILFIMDIMARKISIPKKIFQLILYKFSKKRDGDGKQGYKDLKDIMEKREQEEKEKMRAEVRERLRKKTGLSAETPDLFLALKKTQK